MLGIQQTRPGAPHHPTTRSAATTVAASALRTTPKNNKRPTIVQKPVEDTLSPAQDELTALAEPSIENGSAWLHIPGDDGEKNGAEEGGDNLRSEGVGEEQSGPSLEGVTEEARQAGEAPADQEKGEEGEESNAPGGAETYARHPSSPLSELSPAPDDDDNPNQEDSSTGNPPGGDEGGENKEQSSADARPSDPANPLSLPPEPQQHAAANTSQSSNNNLPSHGGSTGHLTAIASPFSIDPTVIDGLPPSSPLPGSSSQLPHATSTPPSSSPGKKNTENAEAGPSGLSSSSPAKYGPTQKFSVLLELNAELFKVCQAFVASGYVPQETPEAQPFSKRLQSNLTWMSAHVDGVKMAVETPDLDPPTLAPSAAHIAFPEGALGRISYLYAQLTVVFAKDISRRNQKLGRVSGTGTPTSGLRNSSTPSILPPSGIGVKRERPDGAEYRGRESPIAMKRRDTGEGKSLAGPRTPTQPGSAGAIDMAPSMTPGFPTQSQTQMQMNRPGSSMSGMGPMSAGSQPSGLTDGMFPPTSSPGMGMSGGMQDLAGMGSHSPEAQARARQMQMRQAQAQAFMLQQQQHHQQQLQQQHGHGNQQHQQVDHEQQMLQQQGGNTGMSSPQRRTPGVQSPTQQQHMMQAQASSNRHMSPPGTGGGMGMNMDMGMNGTDGLVSSPVQQSGMNSNMSQSGSNMNLNGMGGNASSNMSLNPQILSSMGPAAMTAYQILQNQQHQMTRYINQQMPGFSQLPMMEQIRRFQLLQQRQMQQGQRNQQMMANQMMGGQMRPPNAGASGSGTPQMQQLGQGGQMGIAPQMQSSNSEGGMQFPGTSTSTNMPTRAASSMGMAQQMGGMSGMPNMPNMAGLNPQQRQLYLMQMQMRNGGAGGAGLGVGGMNPSMINPQMLAAAQERQRLEQQRLALAQRQGSPLNPAANNSQNQFPPGLRSNPSSGVGISRTGRSPSVSSMVDMAGAATPRIGGRMLPGSDDYQRAVLLQQAQRNAQMQQQHQQHQQQQQPQHQQQQQPQQQGFMQGQGQGQNGWPGQQQSQQQLPLSAGAWPQQNQQGFSIGMSPSNAGMQSVELMGPPRQTSATPAPMGQHSPTAPTSEFDNMINW